MESILESAMKPQVGERLQQEKFKTKRQRRRKLAPYEYDKHLRKNFEQIYSTTHNSVNMVSGIWRKGNNETLYYIRQFNPEDEKTTKKTFKNILFLDKASIEPLMKVMKEFQEHEEKNTNNTERVLIVDEWYHYRRELAMKVAEEMVKMYDELINELCQGCKEDQPNQLAHELCLVPIEERLDHMIPKMIEKMEIDDGIKKEDILSDNDWLSFTKSKFLKLFFSSFE